MHDIATFLGRSTCNENGLAGGRPKECCDWSSTCNETGIAGSGSGCCMLLSLLH